MPVHLLGAAFTATANYVPTWQAGLGNGNDIGGLIAAILEPAGGFGKFLLVPLALTAPSQCAGHVHSVHQLHDCILRICKDPEVFPGHRIDRCDSGLK